MAAAAALPSWISAGAATIAALAAITYGALNLRRASRGPNGAPRWTLQHVTKSRYALVQHGTADARDVKVWVGEGASRVNGQSEFEVFSVGQQAHLVIATTMQASPVRVHVTWAAREGVLRRRTVRREWSTDVS